MKINAKCVGGKQAYTLCMKIGCERPACMCIDKNCACQKNHLLCLTSTTVSKIMNIVKADNERDLTKLREIYKWYDAQIKLFIIERDEIRKLIDNYQVPFKGGQNMLYQYLVQGKSELILPLHVLSSNNSVSYLSWLLQNLKEQLLQQEIKIKEVLRELRYLTPSPVLELPTLQKTRIGKQLCHPGIKILNNHTVKSSEAGWRLVLLPFDTSGKEYKFRSMTYHFRLRKLANSQFMIGVIQLPPNLTVNDKDIHNKLENGSLTYNGSVYLGKSQGHRKEFFKSTAFATNDEVNVQYERKSEWVSIQKFQNKIGPLTFNNVISYSQIKTRADLPLFVALNIYNPNDQVQLTGVSYS